MRLGRALRHLPECAEAWRDGAIGLDQAQAIASARRHRTESSMARDEAMLVAQAAQMGFEDFYRALCYWKQLADPDGADAADEERQGVSQRVPRSRASAGMWLGQMTLDPVSGSIVAGELNRLEHDLFEADCAEAKERLGRTGRTRRAGPHLGPAPGRRPRRDGHAQPHRPGRRHPPRPALLCLRRL